MQFGILYLFLTLLDDQAFHRYCIPMDSPRPLQTTELEFFNKGTGKGKSNHLVSELYALVPVINLVKNVSPKSSCAN